MAVKEQTPYIEHVANGVTTSFALEFECKDKEHLIVLVDNVEPNVGTWSLANGSVVFGTAPANGKIIAIQRNTPFRRETNFQSYDNSLRPATINKDFDWVWYKLQELGVLNWRTENNITNVNNYVNSLNDETRQEFLDALNKAGLTMSELDRYVDSLFEKMSSIAVDKGWLAEFVVDGNKNQKQINDNQKTINLRTVTPYDFGAVGKGLKIKVQQWTVIGSSPYYPNLAAIQVAYPHVTSLDDYVDWAALQKFFDYVKFNKCNAQANGDFFINKPANFLRNRETFTTVINGDITLRTDVEMTHMLRLTGRHTKWVGYIDLQAESTGSADYSLRKVKHGLVLGGFEEGYTSLGISVDEVRVHGVKELAVFCRDWSMFARIGTVRTSACGFGSKAESSQIHANWNAREESASANEFDQSTVIGVDVLPPDLDADSTILIANINNEPYKVVGVNKGAKRIAVFPKIDTTLTSGQLQYIGGGAFGADGANANCIRVDLLSAVSSGIGCYNRSFYDLQITRFVSEANGIGFVHGKIADQWLNTVVVTNYYNEGDNWIQFLNASRVTNGSNIHILSSSNLSESKMKNVIAYRNSDNTLEKLYAGMGFVSVNIDGRQKQYLKYPGNKTEAVITTYTIEVCDPKQHIYRKNSWTINLTCNESYNNFYGWDSTTIEFIGTGTNNKPTGDFVFIPPSGWTVNALPSVTFRSNTSSLRLSLYANFASKNIAIVSNQAVSATKTFDPPSLAANTTITLTTVTLSGATVGANVNVSFSQLLGVSARIWGEVTAANTVTIYLQNLTTAVLDLVSGDITVKLI